MKHLIYDYHSQLQQQLKFRACKENCLTNRVPRICKEDKEADGFMLCYGAVNIYLRDNSDMYNDYTQKQTCIDYPLLCSPLKPLHHH